MPKSILFFLWIAFFYLTGNIAYNGAMSNQRSSDRRDFLTGKAAGQVAADAIERAADQIGQFADAISPPPTLDSSSAPAGYVVTLSRRAMACEFEIRLNAERTDDDRQTAAAMEALDLVDELESQMTVYRDTSEVVEINRQAAVEPVDVESQLFELLQLSEQLYHDTNGAFDLTSGPLSRVWGFDRRKGKLPTDAQIASARKSVGWDKVQLDSKEQQVRFSQPGVEINLNSIGKGYALDRAGRLLTDADVSSYLLHGGRSTLLAHGNRAGQRGWTARVRHPLRPQSTVAEFVLENEALSTSGSATQSFVMRGKRYGHLIDPRTGWPADSMHSATVVAPSGAMADALSTAFYVLGREKAAEYCAAHPDIKALLVLPSQHAGRVELVTLNLQATTG